MFAPRGSRNNLRRQPGGDEVKLGLAVALTHAGAENLHRLLEFFAGHRRTGQKEIFETRIIVVVDLRMAEHRVKRRRRQEHVCDFVFLNRLHDGFGIESREDNHSRAHSERRHGHRPRSMR